MNLVSFVADPRSVLTQVVGNEEAGRWRRGRKPALYAFLSDRIASGYAADLSGPDDNYRAESPQSVREVNTESRPERPACRLRSSRRSKRAAQ